MAKEITVFTGNGCKYCAIVKQVITASGGTVKERNVHQDPKALEDWEKFGVMGVPVTVIDGKPYVGFNDQVQEAIVNKLKGE